MCREEKEMKKRWKGNIKHSFAERGYRANRSKIKVEKYSHDRQVGEQINREIET